MGEGYDFENTSYEDATDSEKKESGGTGFEGDSFQSYEKESYRYEREPIRYEEIFDLNRPKSRGWSVASMVLGIISVVCCCVGWIGFITSVLAIVFAVVSRVNLKYFDGMSIAGLVLGIFGLVMGIMMIWVTYGPMAEMLDEIYKELENMPTEDYNGMGF